MTDYDFRQHIGEWVETRQGMRVKVVGYNSEADENRQLVIQYPDGDVFTLNVRGRFGEGEAYRGDLVPPVREYRTLVKLWKWNVGEKSAVSIAQAHWSTFDKDTAGNWISEPTEVTFKLLPGVKLP